MARVDDNDKGFGFAGLFGRARRRAALRFPDRVGAFGLVVPVRVGALDHLSHGVGVGRLHVDDDAVPELRDGLGVVDFGLDVVFKVKDDAKHVGLELPRADCRDEVVAAFEVFERALDARRQAQPFDIENQSVGPFAAQHHIAVLELAVGLNRNARAVVARPDAHLQLRGGDGLQGARGEKPCGTQKKFAARLGHLPSSAAASAKTDRPRALLAASSALRESPSTESVISRSASGR